MCREHNYQERINQSWLEPSVCFPGKVMIDRDKQPMPESRGVHRLRQAAVIEGYLDALPLRM
jgi:hypothetical protein